MRFEQDLIDEQQRQEEDNDLFNKLNYLYALNLISVVHIY
jgi:hypothetical protein